MLEARRIIPDGAEIISILLSLCLKQFGRSRFWSFQSGTFAEYPIFLGRLWILSFCLRPWVQLVRTYMGISRVEPLRVVPVSQVANYKQRVHTLDPVVNPDHGPVSATPPLPRLALCGQASEELPVRRRATVDAVGVVLVSSILIIPVPLLLTTWLRNLSTLYIVAPGV